MSTKIAEIIAERQWTVLLKEVTSDQWQSNHFQQILKSDEVKVKITMHHDFHYGAKQSRAKIERWDGTRWHEVIRMDSPQFTPLPGSSCDSSSNFYPLRDKLVELASEIIF